MEIKLEVFKSMLLRHYKIQLQNKMLLEYPITKQLNLSGGIKKESQSQEDFQAQVNAMVTYINTQRELSDKAEEAILSLVDGSILSDLPIDFDCLKAQEGFTNIDDWFKEYVSNYLPEIEDSEHKLYIAAALQAFRNNYSILTGE
jgi:hypothetical protein